MKVIIREGIAGNKIKKVTGNNISIQDALSYDLVNFSASGNCKQKTTTGKQLFNYKDTAKVTNGVTVDEDGWITVSCDNTEGTSTKYFYYFTNNLNLKPNTQYAVVTEIKSINGTNLQNSSFYPYTSTSSQTEGQFTTTKSHKYTSFSSNTIKIDIATTKDSFDNVINGIRSSIEFRAGESASITFRISVLEDTSVTENTFVYEEYTGEIPSPNPSYKQEIEVIDGEFSLATIGKNLAKSVFDKKLKCSGSGDNRTVEEATSYCSQIIKVEPNKTYVISGDFATLKGSTMRLAMFDDIPVIGSISTSFVASTSPLTFTTQPTTNYILLWNSNNTDTIIEDLQVEKDFKTDFESYQEKLVPIDLKGNFIGKLQNGVADRLLYKDRHIYLEKNVGKIVLDGSEAWQDRSDYTYADRFIVYGLFPNNYRDILSTYFIFSRTLQDTYPIAVNNNMQIVINFSAKGTTTLAQFKEWLSEHKPEIYYQLTTPELIDLGEYDLSTLQGTNNISLLANLETDLEIDYYSREVFDISNYKIEVKEGKVEVI